MEVYGENNAKIKKIISFIIVAALFSASLSGCGKLQEALFKEFSIEGKWKNVGETTWGQAQEDAIIAFDGIHCNLFSPVDTYALYAEDGVVYLDCTSLLGDSVNLTVKIKDMDSIVISTGIVDVELNRVK